MKKLFFAFALLFVVHVNSAERVICQEIKEAEDIKLFRTGPVLPGISTNLTHEDIDALPTADRQKLLALRNYIYGCPSKDPCCGLGNVVVTEQERTDLQDIARRNNLSISTGFRYGACHRGCGLGVAAVAGVGGAITLFGGALIGLINTATMEAFCICVGTTGGFTACTACLAGCAECSTCSCKGCCCDEAYTVRSITKKAIGK